jgi:hypothetical protein
MMTPDQAYAAYLQLEGPRTLEGLRQKLNDDGADPPTLHWFQKWSAKDKWRDRAKEHDRQVELRTSEMSVDLKAQERVSAAVKFDQAAIAAVDLVIVGLKELKVTSAEDADRIMKIACLASAEAREIEKGKNPASAISHMADELEKSEGPGQTWAAQLREITSDAPIN